MTHSRTRWTLVPLLAAGGFASAIYTFLLPFQISGETNARELLYLLLGSTTFGLTLLAILWYRRDVRSWQRGAALLAVVVAAHAIGPLLTLTRTSFMLGDIDVPAAGTVELIGPIVMLAAAFAIVLGVLIIVFPERRHFGTPAIAAVCAAAVALVAAYLDAIQHGAWITFWNAVPLWPFWQTGIAAVVGIALWVADVALPLRHSSAERPEERDGATLWTRLKASAVLVGYAIVTAILCLGLLQRRSADFAQRQRQTQSDIARSIADAPSAAVPMVIPKPLSEMLLPEVDGA